MPWTETGWEESKGRGQNPRGGPWSLWLGTGRTKQTQLLQAEESLPEVTSWESQFPHLWLENEV